MKRRFIFVLLCFVPVVSAIAQNDLTRGLPQAPERLRWWQEARFGMFIHWGPVSLKGTEISWSRGGPRRGIAGTGEIPVAVYDSLYREFNPVRFNATEWAAIARSAGMKYIVLVAKHCDGFCMWRSAVDTYGIAATPFGRDVCGELADAARAAGLRIGWYYSPMDWRDPDCRTDRNAIYVGKMQGHLRELLGRYGRVDVLWFDTDGGPAPWAQQETYALVRALQPGIIINNRLDMGSMQDYNDQRIGPEADYRTPEQHVGEFDHDHPWETCMTLGTQWSWKPKDTIKTSAECIRILRRCVTGDGNLLLNVGPMPDGRIEPRQAAVLREIGAWLERYGESVYGTRGGPFRNGDWGGSTNRGTSVYLHIDKWNNREVVLPSLDAVVLRAAAVGGGESVEFHQSADGIKVRMPAGMTEGSLSVIKLELDRTADGLKPS